MKLIFAASLLFCGILRAQTPDCLPAPSLLQTGAGFAPNPGFYDNRTTECVTWTVAYQSDGGISGFTLAFNAATGTNTPGSFSPLTPVASSSGFGTAQYGIATYNVLSATGGMSTIAPFVQVAVTGGSGTGSIRISLYGYRTGTTGGTGGGGGGGGGGGCSSPCPVEGTAFPGGGPVGPPVLTAGIDGTDVRTIKTDTSGNTAVFQIGLGNFTSEQQAVTASAANLGGNASKSVCVKALIGNTINVYVGASGVTTSTGFELPPGQGLCVNVSNTNLIYVIASTTGASVSAEWTN